MPRKTGLEKNLENILELNVLKKRALLRCDALMEILFEELVVGVDATDVLVPHLKGVKKGGSVSAVVFCSIVLCCIFYNF